MESRFFKDPFTDMGFVHANKTADLHTFTPEDGCLYRQLDNFGLKHHVMFDWLDEVLGNRR